MRKENKILVTDCGSIVEIVVIFDCLLYTSDAADE